MKLVRRRFMISMNNSVQHTELYVLQDSGNGFVEGIIFENNKFEKVEFNKNFIVRSYELARLSDDRFEEHIVKTYYKN